MIYKLVFVCALISITASASALKGRVEESTLEGGLKSPIEQHRLIEQHQNAAKTSKLENNAGLEESKQELPYFTEPHNVREQSQQKDEVEVKAPSGLKYEAKQQLSRDELSKVNNKLEHREEFSKTNHFEQKQEAEKLEQFSQQQQQQHDIDSSILENSEQQQVVELKEEQRRLVDEQPSVVRPLLPVPSVEEPIRNEKFQQATKGGAGYVAISQAPIGEAEPYAFSYNVDGSSRSESGDTKGVVRGQYTLSGADGMNRVVEYVADHNGFRASVNTNEFGTEAKSPASVALRTSQPLAEEITLRSEAGRVRESLALTNNANYASKGGIQQKQSWPEENLPSLSESEKKGQQQQQQFISLEQPSKISQRPLFASKGEPARKVPVVEQSQVLVKQFNEHNVARKIPSEQSHAPLKQIAERNDARKGLEEIKREPIRGLKEQQHQENGSGRDYRSPVKSVAPQVAPVRAVAPGVLVRAYPPPAPVVRGPAALVYRPTVNQRGRYPPLSPVQGLRRAHRYESVVPSNPRVSFYGSNLSEDHASFDHPDF